MEKLREFLLGYKKADPARLWIEHYNLYDVSDETRRFNEIICFEVLEHLRRVRDVIKEFYRILRPGGIPHVCCPYRLHPRHQAEVLDLQKTGGHVRPDYTKEDYSDLLETASFQIEEVVEIDIRLVYYADRIMRAIRGRVGDRLALPLFPSGLEFLRFSKLNPRVPFSLYVRAVKRANRT
jgi:SAM-dependent methyltransferase